MPIPRCPRRWARYSWRWRVSLSTRCDVVQGSWRWRSSKEVDVAQPVTMPQLGETVVEGTITKWLKKEGETVERDEPLFEISTDKVDTEVPSPLGGKLVEIKVQEGETVQVGTELALIDSGDGQAAAQPKQEADKEPKQEQEPQEAAPQAPARSEEPA